MYLLRSPEVLDAVKKLSIAQKKSLLTKKIVLLMLWLNKICREKNTSLLCIDYKDNLQANLPSEQGLR